MSPIGLPLAAVLLILLSMLLAFPSMAQEPMGQLRAGAARVEITPLESDLPPGSQGVLDPLYARSIVIENGEDRAALLTVDAGGLPTPLWESLSERAEQELGINRENLLITATHTHSAPFGGNDDYEESLFEALQQAAARLQPARMAFGSGQSWINVNRSIIHPENRRWWEGPDYEGPSDKTVDVLRLETLEGEPIAVYYNYAVHPVVTGNLDMISGDIPGAASAYLEASMGDDAVALWSSGASGDQNPIFFNQTYELRQIRIDDYASRGEDISNAMPPGGQGLDRDNPRVQLLLQQQKQVNSALGLMLAEEVLRVMRSELQRPEEQAVIAGASKVVSCPGRRRLDSGRAGYAGTYEDADPVDIRLSMLRIGDVYIGGVDAEIFNLIAQRLKARSPHANTLMATLTNGTARSGYIPNDEAFAQNTFEVVSSRLKPGCAETAIIDGLLDLVEKVER
ncbi:neutral/alkaline non-lysosomal ceramidase N-terminal domain-containing protein [Aurantiacibacter poecillastricola]|uniref:neutral/alkaline non-lysosomal ceramidase N-terminal domain-containing protein n=1 Tax=Aurantiacibacter poecillastricola TaxID=3064385 RepID=UPI00273E460B|nr:neutral/alkaline non-lysosomal ceramidase N-terminal domain-containing protein [Aurantiacibacter sp. 219JJ12-13]MDP5263027.1 neutral/alkaline non-lysosomal ceramidase N-terminal domain-containing protein [Aurantiacibacter sp. 219JJ12-13]